MPATSAIREHNPGSPETPLASSTHHLAVMLSSGVLAPKDRRRMRSGWRGLPRGATPVELPRNRTRSARAAQVPPIFVTHEGPPWTSIIPIRFARTPSVASSWMHRLESPIHPGACAPFPSPPWTFQSIASLLSRGRLPPNLLSQAVQQRGRFPRSPAKRSAIHRAKVSSIREEHLQRSRKTRLVTQSRLTAPPEVESLSTGCSHPVDKSRAFFIPLRAPL